MKRSAIWVLVLVCSSQSASADREVADHTAAAVRLAHAGDCVAALEQAEAVRGVDPERFAAQFPIDSLAACLQWPEAPPVAEPESPVSESHVATELLAGVGCGLLGGTAGLVVGAIPAVIGNSPKPLVVFSGLGLALGSSTCVYKVGADPDQRGSPGGTFMGTLLGDVGGFWLASYGINTPSAAEGLTIVGAVVVGSAISSTISYHLTRTTITPVANQGYMGLAMGRSF